MITLAMGKRYERLLFFTAPITLAAIIVCLVALASSTQKERITARCYEAAANVFAKHNKELTNYWDSKSKKDEIWFIGYKLKLEKIWIYGSNLDSCYSLVDKNLDETYKKPPNNMIQEWKLKANKLLKTPLSIYGVSLPEDATIGLFGTKIRIEFVTLTRALQIILLPVFLLWLGSLYSTRYRECLLIRSSKSLSEVFPHVINMYPAFDLPSPRKRNILAPYARPIACTVFALVRTALLLIFILPPVGIYVYSLYLVATESTAVPYGIAGLSVIFFSLTTILAEFLPTHFLKVFPDPRNV